jgi:hypothetical protein
MNADVIPGITTRLVDTVTTPMLLKMVEAKKLQPGQLITHSKSTLVWQCPSLHLHRIQV